MTDPMGDAPVIQRAPRAPAKKAAKKKNTRRTVPATPQPRRQAYADAPVARTAPRPPSRPEAARDLSRETTRRGAAVAIGHSGETLTRRRTTVGDQFEVPQNEVPMGWTYQWNTVAVLNRKLEEIEQGDLRMHENGWRPVPASRHPGRWTPVGFEGSIIIEGLRLEERPSSLTIEASAEDTMRARAQLRDRTDALRMTQKALPGAAEARARNAALNMGMKMSIDPALDIPHPELRLDDGSGFDD